MSLKGPVILCTDLVFMFTHASFVIVDDRGRWGLVIESLGADERPVGSLIKLDWCLSEWEDYGWEVILPEEPG